MCGGKAFCEGEVRERRATDSSSSDAEQRDRKRLETDGKHGGKVADLQRGGQNHYPSRGRSRAAKPVTQEGRSQPRFISEKTRRTGEINTKGLLKKRREVGRKQRESPWRIQVAWKI